MYHTSADGLLKQELGQLCMWPMHAARNGVRRSWKNASVNVRFGRAYLLCRVQTTVTRINRDTNFRVKDIVKLRSGPSGFKRRAFYSVPASIPTKNLCS